VLNQVMEKALNTQINLEFSSAYLYLAMSAYFENEDLAGFASWMKHQAKEETEHAMKLFDYVHSRGGRVVLQAIPQPATDFESPLSVFRQAYDHECMVSRSIHDLYDLAVKEKDHATQVHLHWFIEEQVEEEATAQAIVAKLEMAGKHQGPMFMLDRAMAERGITGH